MLRKALTRAVRVCHPLLLDTMQCDERLLFHALDRHGRHLARPDRLEDGLDVRTIRLVAADIRPYVGRRHQAHGMPMLLRNPAPVVGRATRFHDDVRRRCRREEPGKLPPIEAVSRREAPVRIGHRDFEHRLCQVHRHCRRMHRGLLLVVLMGIS